MKGPVAKRVGRDINGQFFTGFRNDCVFARSMEMLSRYYVEEHSMQMNRVRHHRVVHEGEA
ncbi:MAG: hypothetical protein ACI9BW_000675 [Gammaproteobacteria bacterium]|jgi:hypothetical protein